MRRKLFTIAAAVSLLICSATALLWVRSYWGTDYLQRTVAGPADSMSITNGFRGIEWTSGEVRLFRGESTSYPRGAYVEPVAGAPRSYWGWGRLGRGHVFWETPAPRSFWDRLGFYSTQTGLDMSFATESKEWVAFPAWLPVLAFLVLPAAWVVRLSRARRRASAGLCESCGYDLRGTPERCPECGTVPKRRLNRGLT